jgi:hypothetical protein
MVETRMNHSFLLSILSEVVLEQPTYNGCNSIQLGNVAEFMILNC